MARIDLRFTAEQVRDALMGAPPDEILAVSGIVNNVGPFREPFSVDGLRRRQARLLIVVECMMARLYAEARRRAGEPVAQPEPDPGTNPAPKGPDRP